MAGVQMGFERATIRVPLDRLIATRLVASTLKSTEKYRRIAASIAEVGLVEPLVVHPPKEGPEGTFEVLDGHLRLEVLREMAVPDAVCLVSTDDEAYTYNRHVNRMTAMQEHFMLMKALDSGVPEERLARALNLDLQRLREKRDLLRGICADAVAMLRNREIGASALNYLRKVKDYRQVVMAETMIGAKNFTRGYAFALYMATPPELLLEPIRPKDHEGVAATDVARIQTEMTILNRDFKQVEEVHSQNALNLAFLRTYLVTLLGNAQVKRYLSMHHREILGQFEKIVETETIDG